MCQSRPCPKVFRYGEMWVIVLPDRIRLTPDTWQVMVWLHQLGADRLNPA